MKYQSESGRKGMRQRGSALFILLAGMLLVLLLIAILVPLGRSARKPVQGAQPAGAGPSTALPLPTIVSMVQGGIVTIDTFDKSGKPLGSGTGFVAADNGHIVTSRHVVQGAGKVQVRAAGETYSVSGFLAEDIDHDLVILVVSSSPRDGWKPLPYAADPPRIGDRVLVIGTPLGLDLTASDGIVAARRQVQPFGEVIQITSPISAGSSGSPVLNMKGEVIGVATFQAQDGQNINFAIPIARVKELKPSVQKTIANISQEMNQEMNKLGDPLAKAAFLIDRGYYDEAVPFCEEVTSVDFRNARAHCYLGAACLKSNAFRAKKELQMAMEMDAALPEAHHYMAVYHFENKDYQEAENSLAEAVRLRPGYFEALVNLGAVYYTQQRFRKALDVLDRALGLQAHARAYTWLGLTYAELARGLDAVRTLERAIDLDEDYKYVYIAMAYVTIKMKNWRVGIRHLSTATVKWPKDLQFHYYLGLLHVGNGDLAEAEEELSKIRRINDYDVQLDKLGKSISDYKYGSKSPGVFTLRPSILYAAESPLTGRRRE